MNVESVEVMDPMRIQTAMETVQFLLTALESVEAIQFQMPVAFVEAMVFSNNVAVEHLENMVSLMDSVTVLLTLQMPVESVEEML